MSSAEPPRDAGADGSGPDRLPSRPARPLSRDDLFRPDGPLTGRAPVTEDSAPTAERPPVPGEPPRPRRGPRPARNLTPGPAASTAGGAADGDPGAGPRAFARSPLEHGPFEPPADRTEVLPQGDRTRIGLSPDDRTQVYPATAGRSGQPTTVYPATAAGAPPVTGGSGAGPSGPAAAPATNGYAGYGPGAAAPATDGYAGYGPGIGSGPPAGGRAGSGDPADGYGAPLPAGYPEHGAHRSRRSTLLGGLAVAAVIVAVAVTIGVLLNRGENRQVAGPQPAPAAGAPAAPDATSDPGTGDDPETTATTDAKAFRPIPAEPWEDDRLDFGYLTEVFEDGDDIVLVINRASFYHGAEATRRNGGEAPENDYLIEDSNPRLRRFVLEPGASIRGSSRLSGPEAGTKGAPVQREDFVRLVQEAVAAGAGGQGGTDDESQDGAAGTTGEGIPIWLRHADGEDGPVTAFAEQYLP